VIEIKVVKLDENCNYEALSYLRGDAALSETIHVKSQKRRKTIKVTTGLLLALRHLCYSDKERVLWIDAL
jgi:hypothetical protein